MGGTRGGVREETLWVGDLETHQEITSSRHTVGFSRLQCLQAWVAGWGYKCVCVCVCVVGVVWWVGVVVGVFPSPSLNTFTPASSLDKMC